MAAGPAGGNLPREIIKWLQSLDLSFAVKNPKRDFANGYLVAEILSRYYLKEIDMNCFENGTRLAAKVDNWEQIYKFARKRGVPISKQEIDPVIHCAPGAATAFLFHLYNILTKRTVQQTVLVRPDQAALPAFMRETASKRMKDNEIARVEDNFERMIRAIDTLGSYHEERRTIKASEAPILISKEHRRKLGVVEAEPQVSSRDLEEEPPQVEEVTVKANVRAPGLRKDRDREAEQVSAPARGPGAHALSGGLVKAVTSARSSVGALANISQPGFSVKPAADIMRPLVVNVLGESEELGKLIDLKKDVMVSMMELIREGLPEAAGRDAQRAASNGQLALEPRVRELEESIVRVFEMLANRAQLLTDTLTKSPHEFWKVWTLFFPLLSTFPESSPFFESGIFLFKRLGEVMRDGDGPLTQQLFCEVGLPLLIKELSKAPEKQENLCEVMYSFTTEDTLNHLLLLRSLKEKVGDSMPLYVSCLSCLIPLDAQLGLLDEHLLDLYIYYTLVAIQSPQPRVRVSGVSILSTITVCSSQYQSVLQLVPNLEALTEDDWWEVQAQLLQLCAHLLHKLSIDRRPGVDGEEVADSLLSVVSRLFVVNNNKEVLQVGLSALVQLLQEYPTLLPVFVAVLLAQPPAMRKSILQSHSGSSSIDRPSERRAYVMGSASRMYEEKRIASFWPHLDVAKTLVMQVEASQLERFELEHTQVLLASLPEQFAEEDAGEWLGIFSRMQQHIFTSLVDPELHILSVQIIKRFWTSRCERVVIGSIQGSKMAFLQTLSQYYAGDGGGAGAPLGQRVEEASLIQFLKDFTSRVGMVSAEIRSILESFSEAYPKEFAASQLRQVMG